ncbi:MAG: hypothetical protein ACRYFZ_15600 [Janthinobacterium lividum]
MKRFRSTLLGSLATVVLSTSACHPDQAATQSPATGQPTTKEPAGPAAPPAAVTHRLPAGTADTLHLTGGVVVRLQPSTAAAFNRLPADTVAEAYSTDPEPIDLAQLRVRRRGLDLRLQPTAGPLVKLSSVPDAQFTLQNSDAVRYQYLGSLPRVHQWVVRANFWESDGTVLVDQRTGRYLEQPGRPFASPDGRHLVLCSPGLGGGDQVNKLSLVRVDATGPHLVWQREPTAWEAKEARWASPTRVVLKRRHTLPDGSMPDDARVTYDELTLPR